MQELFFWATQTTNWLGNTKFDAVSMILGHPIEITISLLGIVAIFATFWSSSDFATLGIFAILLEAFTTTWGIVSRWSNPFLWCQISQGKMRQRIGLPEKFDFTQLPWLGRFWLIKSSESAKNSSWILLAIS